MSSAEIQFAFQTTRPGNDDTSGVYTYYPDQDNNKTKILVNHNADPHASIQSSAQAVTNPANHFHAGVIAGQAVTRVTANPTNINLTQTLLQCVTLTIDFNGALCLSASSNHRAIPVSYILDP